MNVYTINIDIYIQKLRFTIALNKTVFEWDDQKPYRKFQYLGNHNIRRHSAGCTGKSRWLES